MSAIFTKLQLATLAEILEGIFHLKQTVSYFLLFQLSKPIAGIILQLPCQLTGIKLQLTLKTGWTILYYYCVVTDIALTVVEIYCSTTTTISRTV
jgi:hypothetical protein